MEKVSLKRGKGKVMAMPAAMMTGGLTDEDRLLLRAFTEELRRRNDLDEAATEIPEILFSCGEAAVYLKVTPQTISNMLKKKRLTKVMRNNRWGILKSEIDLKCATRLEAIG